MYKKDERYHSAIEILKPYVEKYSEEENLEIEFRLGYVENGEFRAGIGKDFFEKILNILNSTDVWTNVKKETTTDYLLADGRRLTGNMCIKKEKLAVVDFEIIGSGFDLRVSFCKEMPAKPFDPKKADKIREKHRSSFFYKYTSYDITDVIVDDNGVKDHKYEFEIEIVKLDLKSMTSTYLVHSLLLKITDVIKMCEDDLENFEIELLKEKVF